MKHRLCGITIGAIVLAFGCDRQPEGAAETGPAAAGKESPQVQTTTQRITASDVTRDARRAAETAAEYSKQTADSLRRDLQDKLSKLDGEIRSLKERGASLSEKMRQQWQEQMDRVAEKREALKTKIDDLQNSSAGAWDEMKAGIAAAWEDMSVAYEKAREAFKRSDGAPESQPRP